MSPRCANSRSGIGSFATEGSTRSRRAKPRLLDQRQQLEHREVHRDDDHADHQADADHHDRLDDRGERRDRRVHLVLVEIGDLAEHLLELSRLFTDLHHLRHHRRENRVFDQRLRNRHTFVHPLTHVGESVLDHPVAGRLPGDLERLDDVDARGDERRKRAGEARHRHLEDDVADLHRHLELERIPAFASGFRRLPATEAEDRADQRGKDDEPVVLEDVRRDDDQLRQLRELAPELREDLHEDRHEEEQHSGQDQGREDQDHDRVDHRALHAALDLRLLLDLERNAVENGVEDAGRLARLDHRDVEAVEDLRVARHRLREEEPALDVAAQLLDDRGEILVVGLLLEDDEGRDDVQTGLDHRRELAREDLERLWLDLLEEVACALFPRGGELVELARQEAADAQLLPRPEEIGSVKLAGELKALGVDGGIGERSHSQSLYRAIGRGVEPLKRAADSSYVHTRARDESGFGLLELLMAMVMLNVGILAIVGAFSSGNVALARANRISTGAALANKQMEVYRGLKYDNILFVTSEWNSAIADSTYTSDEVYQQNMENPIAPKALVSTVTTCPTNVPASACDPSYTTTGADHRSYRVDTYL